MVKAVEWGVYMKEINIGQGAIRASEIALGCMRMADLPIKEAEALVKTALDEGINFFDHADIYGGGRSEEVFAKAIGMSPSIREKNDCSNEVRN